MTIGVDIRVLTRGARTGVEEYTINLLSRLLKLGEAVNFKLFYSAFRKENFEFDWAKLPNVDLFEARFPSRPFFLSSAYLDYPKIDKLLGGCDVYFNPHFFNSAIGRQCRKVVTFHDLSFKYYPELFSWRKRFWHNFFVNPQAEANKADKIIAVSESTKQDLIDLYKIPAQKIRVIYSGVGEEFRKLEIGPSVGGWKLEIMGKYHLPDKYILYFGTIEPRKNIAGLIRAFEILKKNNKNFSDLCLVIAGGRGWLYDDIFRAASRSKFSQQIIFTGFVAPEDKVYLYNLASLFVYPSFFEGFGFPPLEAMACGVPTITSNNSSLPEVVGDAALMVDPYDIDQLVWAMEQVLIDEKLKPELISRGLEHVKMFSWDKCAEETLNFLVS